MTIGERIRETRKSKGVSQTWLAAAVGEKPQNLNKYESGVITNIPISKIAEMADALGVSPAYLAGWDDAGETTSESVSGNTNWSFDDDRFLELERKSAVLEYRAGVLEAKLGEIAPILHGMEGALRDLLNDWKRV